MLLPEQIEALAKPLVKMIPEMIKFYEDAENEKRYQEWYSQKYGSGLKT